MKMKTAAEKLGPIRRITKKPLRLLQNSAER